MLNFNIQNIQNLQFKLFITLYGIDLMILVVCAACWLQLKASMQHKLQESCKEMQREVGVR